MIADDRQALRSNNKSQLEAENVGFCKSSRELLFISDLPCIGQDQAASPDCMGHGSTSPSHRAKGIVIVTAKVSQANLTSLPGSRRSFKAAYFQDVGLVFGN